MHRLASMPLILFVDPNWFCWCSYNLPFLVVKCVIVLWASCLILNYLHFKSILKTVKQSKMSCNAREQVHFFLLLGEAKWVKIPQDFVLFAKFWRNIAYTRLCVLWYQSWFNHYRLSDFQYLESHFLLSQALKRGKAISLTDIF